MGERLNKRSSCSAAIVLNTSARSPLAFLWNSAEKKLVGKVARLLGTTLSCRESYSPAWIVSAPEELVSFVTKSWSERGASGRGDLLSFNDR